jgi:hypothetical protein
MPTVVLPDGVHTSMTSVIFCARLPKRTGKGHQAFIPCDDGALSAVEPSLLSQELLL